MTMILSNNPEDFPRFSKLNEEKIQETLKQVSEFVNKALKTMKVDPAIVHVHKKIMYTIIDRVEKRRVYFHIYHKSELGELNEGALYCFWILKLNPFYSEEIPNSIINTSIAFYYLIITLQSYIQKDNRKNNKNRSINLNSHIIEDTLYAFRFRDLSKEAIMLYAESLIIEDITKIKSI